MANSSVNQSLPVIDSSNDRTLAPGIDVDALRQVLEKATTGEVRFDRLSRALYSTDASVYQIIPLGVVIPRVEEDVVATLEACRRFHVPVTARGGGTSQAGQAIGPGIQLDCSKYLHRVLQINARERWVRVQPGCVLDDLNQELRPLGLHFAPDVSTSNRATIGGMIANNSSGSHSIIYGKTIDHVLDLRVALSNGQVVQLGPLDEKELESKYAQTDREGECYRVVRRLVRDHAEEIERRYPKILRRVGGYNLDLGQRSLAAPSFNMAHLVVGSEGTLALTLEAKLRLVELPKARALLVVQFHDLLHALAAAPAILKHQVAAVEVVDKYVLDSTRLNPEADRLRGFLQGDPEAILLIEFFGDGAEELSPRLDKLAAKLKRHGFGYHMHQATDPAEQTRIWSLRKAALGLSMAQRGDAKAISFVEDTAVAPEHLREYIAEFLKIVERHGTTAGVYAHASVGCLHVRPVIDLKTENGIRQFESIAHQVAELVLKYGGALSGEHGDGLVRSPFQEKMYGPKLYQAFRELKRAFDPDNLLNPGKIVDAPPLTANLRYGPTYVTPEIPTLFDFSAEGGMTRAAELCAGVGACRKKREGTMCPSYQATRDEQHSTRGRANALRLALTGQLGFDGLTDQALRDALDLCLECKACKSECPTSVDMARLKAEFLHHYYQKYGFPLRNRIFGHLAELGRWGCRLAPVSNWLARSRAGRWLNDKLLGIDRRRLPPRFARRPWKPAYVETDRDVGASDEVLLFPDTFVGIYEPQLAQAAVKLLARLGARVVPGLRVGDRALPGRSDREPGPSQLRCCGRPLISNGFLAEAVENARHNVEQLYPWLTASADRRFFVCEPSCAMTIKEDYPAMLRGNLRRQAVVVADRCTIFEELLGKWLALSHKVAQFRPGPRRILVQIHCHQRASPMGGTGTLMQVLGRIPGAEVIDLNAGCCGMAGSFGYEKEHYEVSRLVGEQRLFPALRQADAETVVVAPGFSCRMQIEHFTGRRALHPAELLWELLER
jgi:FAD/FMN-containing dehydrogenase/Fe-S oxidoreductase